MTVDKKNWRNSGDRRTHLADDIKLTERIRRPDHIHVIW